MFHKKEELDNYNEYRPRRVNKNTADIMCIYSRRNNVKFSAGFDVTPKKDEKRTLFYINKELPLNKDNWAVVLNICDIVYTRNIGP